jgi:hypothetical protein
MTLDSQTDTMIDNNCLLRLILQTWGTREMRDEVGGHWVTRGMLMRDEHWGMRHWWRGKRMWGPIKNDLFQRDRGSKQTGAQAQGE